MVRWPSRCRCRRAAWWPCRRHAARIKEVAAIAGRAQQPADRLRPGRRPRRHRRPDHRRCPTPRRAWQLPAAARHHAAAGTGLAAAAQERRRGDGDRAAAGLRAARPDDRRQRVVAGQCQVAQGRHADRDAAARRRRRDLCAGPGQPGGRRRRRVGRRQQGADQPPERRPRARAAPRSSARCRRRCSRATRINLGLNASDFQTARRVAQAINTQARRRPRAARSTAARCRCARRPTRTRASASSPSWRSCRSSLPSPAAKVVINARTGSIVLNQAVTLGPCAIAHGNLSVTHQLDAGHQPAGAAVAAARPWWPSRPSIQITQEPGILIQVPAGAAARRRGARAQRARRHAAGPAGDPAGDQGRRRAERRTRGDLMRRPRAARMR